MSTKVTPTLKRLLRQLRTMKAMIDAQIALIQRALRAPRGQRATKRAQSSRPVGYARDRLALAARKRAQKRG